MHKFNIIALNRHLYMPFIPRLSVRRQADARNLIGSMNKIADILPKNVATIYWLSDIHKVCPMLVHLCLPENLKRLALSLNNNHKANNPSPS